MEDKPRILSQEYLKILTEMYATIHWIARGQMIDDNHERMESDWIDAFRMVGFKIGDEILTKFFHGIYFDIPSDYEKYLNSITIEDYKRIKAYLIWQKRTRTVRNGQNHSKEDYYNACSFLPEEGRLMRAGELKASSTLLDYIIAVSKDTESQKVIPEEGESDFENKPSLLYEKTLSDRKVKPGKGHPSDVRRVLKTVPD